MCPNDSSYRILACVLLLWVVLAPARAIGQPRFEDEQQNAAGDSKDVYEPGGDVKPPKLVHYIEPAFSDNSKEAFVEGTVKISTIVTVDGLPTECKVVSGLTAGQDKTALEALKQWRFRPGTKGGKPVKVKVTVEVGFHLL